MAVHPIILCGGPGSRLWPSSTPGNPKPFLDLVGGHSLFQRTVLRMAALDGAQPPVVVAGRAHVGLARAQLAAIGVKGTIIAEPMGRDSGPALLVAAEWIARSSPGAIACAVASDHHIPDIEAFSQAVEAGRPAAESGRIVTFGIRPTGPAVAYGYIRAGEALAEAPAASHVRQFVEKPDLARAGVLVSEGCLWNSGNFMCRTDILLAEAETHAPEMIRAVRAALDESPAETEAVFLAPSFGAAPKVSIDVAVMEKTGRAAVLPIAYAWSDLGAWDAVREASTLDEQGNAVSGVAAVSNTRNSLVRAEDGARVLALGLDGIAVVAKGAEVLVCRLDHAADLKRGLATLDRNIRERNRFDGGSILAGQVSAASRLRRWLWEQALPIWWSFGADHQGGGFHEKLAQNLEPVRAPRRARVQARQAYVYATAGRLGWPGPWSAAATHGIDYLIARYKRPDGLFRTLVDPDGAPLDDAAVLYDQAFVLLALAAVAQALPERRAEHVALAEALAEAVDRAFARGEGYRAEEVSESFLSDPVMHLFEATLAWVEADAGDHWYARAARLAALFLDRMVDAGHGRIVETFDDQWRPHPGDEGRRLEPGHHFEWAWLMERWSRLSGDERAHDVALKLFASGERGVDPATGLAVDDLSDDFSVLTPTSRLWPQTERVKAALILAPSDTGRGSEMFAVAQSAACAIEAYLDTPVAGLWRDTPWPTDASAGAAAPASSFYHIVGAIAALAELDANVKSRR